MFVFVSRHRSLSLVVARCHLSSLVISLSLSCMHTHTHTATLSLSSSTHSLSLVDCCFSFVFFRLRHCCSWHFRSSHPSSISSLVITLHLTVPPPYRSYVQYNSLFATVLYTTCRSYQKVSSSVNSFELKKLSPKFQNRTVVFKKKPR